MTIFPNRLDVFARAATLVVALIGLSAGTSFAQIINYNGNAATHRADGPYTIGNLFTVGSENIWITHLGAQDDSAAGPTTDGFFAGNINVGLWNATGTTLLATASVPSTGSLFGSYRYAPVAGSPITLNAGTQYLIGAAVGGGLEWFEDSGAGAAPFVGNGVTLDASRFNSGGTLTAPLSPGVFSARPLGRCQCRGALRHVGRRAVAVYCRRWPGRQPKFPRHCRQRVYRGGQRHQRHRTGV